MRRAAPSPYDSAEYHANRLIALARANYRCEWPGCTNPASTADHIIPLALGGSHDLTNLRASCQACNSRGGAALSNEARRARRLGRRSRKW